MSLRARATAERPRRSKQGWLDLAEAIGGFLVKHGNAQERKEWGLTLRRIRTGENDEPEK